MDRIIPRKLFLETEKRTDENRSWHLFLQHCPKPQCLLSSIFVIYFWFERFFFWEAYVVGDPSFFFFSLFFFSFVYLKEKQTNFLFFFLGKVQFDQQNLIANLLSPLLTLNLIITTPFFFTFLTILHFAN